MRRRAPLQKLRGCDPVLLEVQLQELLLRPSAQIEPPNLADLFALDELDDAPRSIRSRLRLFIDRARGEMAEITDGSEFKQFVAELGQVEPSRVPANLRAFLRSLADRDGRDSRALVALLDSWGDTPPEPFELGAPTIRMQKAAAAPATGSKPRRERTRTTRTDRAVGGSQAPRPSNAGRAAPRAQLVDPERQRWLRDTLLERLATASESGLGERVLLAGLKHRAREVYPDLLPTEVLSMLNELHSRGLVRKSAGRWSRG